MSELQKGHPSSGLLNNLTDEELEAVIGEAEEREEQEEAEEKLAPSATLPVVRPEHELELRRQLQEWAKLSDVQKRKVQQSYAQALSYVANPEEKEQFKKVSLRAFLQFRLTLSSWIFTVPGLPISCSLEGNSGLTTCCSGSWQIRPKLTHCSRADDGTVIPQLWLGTYGRLIRLRLPSALGLGEDVEVFHTLLFYALKSNEEAEGLFQGSVILEDFTDCRIALTALQNTRGSPVSTSAVSHGLGILGLAELQQLEEGRYASYIRPYPRSH